MAAPVTGLGRPLVAAAPILFDAFIARRDEKPVPLAACTAAASLFSTSAKLPPPLRHFRPGGVVASDSGNPPLKIMYPPNNSRIELTRLT